MNSIEVTGRLGKDPQITKTKTGLDLCKFSIACWQGKDKPTMWLDCVAFHPVEAKKGDKIKIGGYLSYQEWISIKDNTKKGKFELVAKTTQLVKAKETDFPDDLPF